MPSSLGHNLCCLYAKSVSHVLSCHYHPFSGTAHISQPQGSADTALRPSVSLKITQVYKTSPWPPPGGAERSSSRPIPHAEFLVVTGSYPNHRQLQTAHHVESITQRATCIAALERYRWCRCICAQQRCILTGLHPYRHIDAGRQPSDDATNVGQCRRRRARRPRHHARRRPPLHTASFGSPVVFRCIGYAGKVNGSNVPQREKLSHHSRRLDYR